MVRPFRFAVASTSGMLDVLRCRSLEGIRKELLMFALVYNSVRAVSVQPEPSEEEKQAVRELLEQMDPEAREALQNEFRLGKTAEEFANRIMVGECPKCRSEDTDHCEHDPEINEILVCRCYDCGRLWRTECGCLLNTEAPLLINLGVPPEDRQTLVEPDQVAPKTQSRLSPRRDLPPTAMMRKMMEQAPRSRNRPGVEYHRQGRQRQPQIIGHPSMLFQHELYDLLDRLARILELRMVTMPTASAFAEPLVENRTDQG